MRAPKTKTVIRQDQIARAALDLISRHGLRALKVAGLARAVGVVPSGLYRHYPNKEAVLAAVLDLVGRRLLENVAAARRAAARALDRLEALLDRHVALLQGEMPIPRVVFSEDTFLGPKPRRQRVYRLFRRYLGGIAGLIREGQQAGEIRPGPGADALSVMFLGLVQPAGILWLMSDGAFDLAGQTRAAWSVFRAAIATGPTPAAPSPPPSRRPVPRARRRRPSRAARPPGS